MTDVRNLLAPYEPGPLPSMVQAATSQIHKEAERRPFMAAYLRGDLSAEAYATYLARLVPVYDALAETATLHTTSPLAWFTQPILDRRGPLHADIVALAGPDWKSSLHAVSPAAETYAARIREVAGTPAWVPQQWLRTLGYLMGQSMLRDLTRKNLGEDAPVAFYEFSGVEEPRTFAREYHSHFDTLTTDDTVRLSVIDEAYRAFALQIALTDELAVEFGPIA